jgi:hypothetical protein
MAEKCLWAKGDGSLNFEFEQLGMVLGKVAGDDGRFTFERASANLWKAIGAYRLENACDRAGP